MKNIIISLIGKLIPKGKFVKHSVFERITNFINHNGHIVSVSDSDKYLSPNTILVNSESYKSIDNIEISETNIELNNEFYPISEIKKFDSFFYFDEKINIDFNSKITKFEGEYLSMFNEKSLRFLLDGKYEQNFKTSFEKAFVKHIKEAYNEIKKGNFYDGISKMKGAGFGLTPSGDDFIAGMLYACDVLIKYGVKINTDVKKIREISKSNNPISDSLIYYASKGAYYKRFKDFIEAFLYKEENLNQAFNNLIEIGETSSSDMLSGFLIQLKSINLL